MNNNDEMVARAIAKSEHVDFDRMHNADEKAKYLRFARAAIAALSQAAPEALQQSRVEPVAPQDIEADTGHPEADRLLGRLCSADPDHQDCFDAAVLIRTLVVEHKGPHGFPTWKDAAEIMALLNTRTPPADAAEVIATLQRTAAEIREQNIDGWGNAIDQAITLLEKLSANAKGLSDAEWAELWKLRAEVQGPNGFATWKDAAVAERLKRIAAESALYTAAPEREGLSDAEIKYVSGVVNNNQPGHDVILRPRDGETIPVGTMMIACPHPDLSHDCCIWCGMNMAKPACNKFRKCEANSHKWCADCGCSELSHAPLYTAPQPATTQAVEVTNSGCAICGKPVRGGYKFCSLKCSDADDGYEDSSL
jgi:hypothetical protein